MYARLASSTFWLFWLIALYRWTNIVLLKHLLRVDSVGSFNDMALHKKSSDNAPLVCITNSTSKMVEYTSEHRVHMHPMTLSLNRGLLRLRTVYTTLEMNMQTVNTRMLIGNHLEWRLKSVFSVVSFISKVSRVCIFGLMILNLGC